MCPVELWCEAKKQKEVKMLSQVAKALLASVTPVQVPSSPLWALLPHQRLGSQNPLVLTFCRNTTSAQERFPSQQGGRPSAKRLCFL